MSLCASIRDVLQDVLWHYDISENDVVQALNNIEERMGIEECSI
jgi:hypothetical protein